MSIGFAQLDLQFWVAGAPWALLGAVTSASESCRADSEGHFCAKFLLGTYLFWRSYRTLIVADEENFLSIWIVLGYLNSTDLQRMKNLF